jgi:hypothetical protein
VQAVVEGGDHLVLTVDARVDAGQRAQPVEAQHGESFRGEGAEVAAGTLDPHQLDWLCGDGVGGLRLCRRVASGVVRVARIGAEPVAAPQQRGDFRVGHGDLLRSCQ